MTATYTIDDHAEKMLEAQTDAASAMLAALRRVMAEADFGDETLAADCNAAIREAEAAGIVAIQP